MLQLLLEAYKPSWRPEDSVCCAVSLRLMTLGVATVTTPFVVFTAQFRYVEMELVSEPSTMPHRLGSEVVAV